MRAVVQRVGRASVSVREPDGDGGGDGGSTEAVVGSIGVGLLALLGATHDDDLAAATKMAEKLWRLRVFADDEGRMNRSLADRAAAGEEAGALVVSQFTLYGDTRKGRRPSFVAAAEPEHAEPLIRAVAEHLEELGAAVATGRFRADMAVSLVNDGPVTLIVET
jgi:D-tyrosyl-tRNA(Tyr) deacylase